MSVKGDEGNKEDEYSNSMVENSSDRQQNGEVRERGTESMG